MTASTTLPSVRQALYDLLAAALPGDVEFGWDAPADPGQVDGSAGSRRSVWLRSPVAMEVNSRTLPNGWTESWTQQVLVQVLPADASVTVPEADTSALEVVDAVIEPVIADARFANGVEAGWSVLVTIDGWRWATGRIGGADGYAVRCEVDVRVEATRC